MAVWGAPVAQDNHCERAMKAALEMRRSLDDWNRFRTANGETPILARAGLNSGRVVAGYMGSTQTMSYTVIGDTVNTAARLCSFAEAGQILISTPIAEELKGVWNWSRCQKHNSKARRGPSRFTMFGPWIKRMMSLRTPDLRSSSYAL